MQCIATTVVVANLNKPFKIRRTYTNTHTNTHIHTTRWKPQSQWLILLYYRSSIHSIYNISNDQITYFPGLSNCFFSKMSDLISISGMESFVYDIIVLSFVWCPHAFCVTQRIFNIDKIFIKQKKKTTKNWKNNQNYYVWIARWRQ